jgi:uncharacterized protein
MSMGGEEAIGAIAADPRIAAVVAEGATNRVAADKAWLVDEHGWRGGIQQALDQLTSALVDVLTDADRPIALREAVGVAAPRPVLLVVGGAEPDEAPAARWIQQGAPESVEVWVVDGAGHTAALAHDRAAWIDHVDSFLTAALHPDRSNEG